MRPRGPHRFEQRLATITSVLRATGHVRLEGDRVGRRRYVRFDVEAPGAEMAVLGRFKYEEWYERDRSAWRLTRYHYDYWDEVRGARLGYHWHRLVRREPIHHAHCEPSGPGRIEPHFRFYEMDLLEAHAEFAKLYALEQPIDCSGLRPLILH